MHGLFKRLRTGAPLVAILFRPDARAGARPFKHPEPHAACFANADAAAEAQQPNKTPQAVHPQACLDHDSSLVQHDRRRSPSYLRTASAKIGNGDDPEANLYWSSKRRRRCGAQSGG